MAEPTLTLKSRADVTIKNGPQIGHAYVSAKKLLKKKSNNSNNSNNLYLDTGIDTVWEPVYLP